MKLLKNENGNMIVFIVGFFSVFFILFLIILNFSNVFIYKQHASSNAEQASIVASGILLDYLEEAIEEYDDWLQNLLILDPIPNEVIGLHPLKDDVREAMNDMPNSLSNLEKRHKAINKVLKKELPINPLLRNFVRENLNNAKSEIIEQVKSNIEENKGEIYDSKIVFNKNHRMEVKTTVRLEAFNFDKYLKEDDRKVKQTGYGPTFEFADSYSNWEFSFDYSSLRK